MYKCIIGLSNCPSISPQHHTSHTHTRKWGIRPKCTSAVCIRAPSAWSNFVIKTARGQPRRQPRTPSACTEYTLKAARRNGVRKVKYTRAFRLLFIGHVLKTDSKTKPTSKLNCRVIIFIYKLVQRVQNETSFRQLRAMNELFRFLYSTSTKNINAYPSSLLL